VRERGEKNGRKHITLDLFYVFSLPLLCGGSNQLQVLANISGIPDSWCISSAIQVTQIVPLCVMSYWAGFYIIAF
jgi:hypothetical protein